MDNYCKRAVFLLAVTSLVFLDGCKKDEVVKSRTELLLGNWRLTEFDGEDFSDGSYSLIFTIERSGNLDFCEEWADNPDFNNCSTNNNWWWQDSNESTLIFTIDSVESKLNIVILDESKLEGETDFFVFGGTGVMNYVKFSKVQ